MPRIISLDYGLRRTGIAVTDPLQLIATGLTTVSSPDLIAFLRDYFRRETVESILVGYPLNLDHSETDASRPVQELIRTLKKEFPQLPVQLMDERFTSRIASRSMIEMGLKKKQRRNKKLIDEIAATILLQDYLLRYPGR
jgi:putative Holliday junction resolvase